MRTVKCRIALAVDASGAWSAAGGNASPKDKRTEWERFDYILDGIESGEARFIVEVDVPVPEVKTVTGEVKPCADS